jgi:hypothetical protein
MQLKNAVGARAPKRKTTSDGFFTSNILLYSIIFFIGLYALAQLYFLGFLGGVFTTGQAAIDKAHDKAAKKAALEEASSQSSSLEIESATVSSSIVLGQSINSLSGDGSLAFSFGRSEELPFPPVDMDDEGIPALSVVKPEYIERGRQLREMKEAERNKPKETRVEKYGKYSGVQVTVKTPCWADYRLLWRMGLDFMADDQEDDEVPGETRRSRAPHAFAELASNLVCTFHSTPIAGGLQCCCESNTTLPYSDNAKVQSQTNAGTFFCLPSTIFLGAKNAGVGLLAGFMQQHAYLQFAEKQAPTRVMTAVKSQWVVDGVMPRYAAHYSRSMVPGWQDLEAEKRRQLVSGRFWIDVSPEYLYGINTGVLLRKLLPRSKVIILLRDPVERAYIDLVNTVRREQRKSADESVLIATHACMKKITCDISPTSLGSISPYTWGEKKTEGKTHVRTLFQNCLIGALENTPGVFGGEFGGKGPEFLTCVNEEVQPGGEGDWGQLFRSAMSRNGGDDDEKLSSLSSCTSIKDWVPESGISGLSIDLKDEGLALWSSLPFRFKLAISSCADAPVIANIKQNAPTPKHPEKALLLAAVARAAEKIEACSVSIGAGVAMPVPTDLMAANVNGYDLGLFAVAGAMPKTGSKEDTNGKVLIDGTKECFPDGVDSDNPAAPLARSIYLRHLQRLHAAYGRETVLVYQTPTLRTDPGAILDDIFEKLSVYKPTLDPVQARTTCRSMGWSAMDVEADCSVIVPLMDDEVKAAIEAVLRPYNSALKAYLGEDEKKADKA